MENKKIMFLSTNNKWYSLTRDMTVSFYKFVEKSIYQVIINEKPIDVLAKTWDETREAFNHLRNERG